MNIVNFLKKTAEKDPQKIAVIFNEQKSTYDELFKKVSKFSSAISELTQSKIISIMSENSLSFIISYLGILNSGKIVHLIPDGISTHNLISQINSTNTDALICSKKCFKNIDYSSFNCPILQFDTIEYESKKYQEMNKSNEDAYLIHTSGTTSEPKGVCVTHKMIEFTTKNIVDVLRYTKNDIDVLPLPLYHSFGLGCLHTSLYTGSTLVLLENTNDLQNILSTLQKYDATTLAAIPATLTKLLQFPDRDLRDIFKHLRLIITNSTAIPKNTILQFRELLRNGNLATYYGLTEASRSTFMIFDKNTNKIESVGLPAPGVEIRITDENLRSCRGGEIWIKGNNVIKKYWNDTSPKNFDGEWLRTGDIGYFDEDNYLFLLGRNDDVINVGGEKIFPNELEDIIKQIPGVVEVAAFGIKHDIFGQVVKVHIVKTNHCNVDKVKVLNYCIKNLEKFKIPAKIEFVESIPKTEYGKIKRFMLK